MRASRISWPSGTREIINDIRGAIGRDINIYSEIAGSACPSCSLDPLTGKSLDPFCDICSGEGYITTFSATTVSAHVNWRQVNPALHYATGDIYTGDCKATVEYFPEIEELVKSANYFEIDGKIMYMEKYDLKGVQDINRIAISLLQDPRDGRLT